MPTPSTCQREIEDLHAFFVDWFCGEREACDRVERALAPEFEMVTPDGDRRDRTAVIEGVRGSHGREAPGEFEIEIRNVEPVAVLDDHALVRYEEWQTSPDGETGRLGTALFRDEADAPNGVAWVYLQETWLDR